MKTPGVVSGTEGTPLSGGGWNTVVIDHQDTLARNTFWKCHFLHLATDVCACQPIAWFDLRSTEFMQQPQNLRHVNNNKGSGRGFYLLKYFFRMPPRDNHFHFP